MNKSCDLVINNALIATMVDENPSFIEKGSLAVAGGKIVYVGKQANCQFTAQKTINANNLWLLPGFIDCHTHLVHAGNRSNEFDLRLQGMSYEEISSQGGGIKNTVNATRNATEEELLASAIKRAKRLLEEGVTCIEIKSGYGLDLETECKMLRVAKTIEQHLPIKIVTTYLGAHAVPPEFVNEPDKYIDLVCNKVIPLVAEENLACAVDVFCESIGFSPSQCERVYIAAQQHNLRIKAHVEQLSDLKGAVLACQFGADSVDHLEYLNPADVPTIAKHQATAVIIPGAYYCLNEKQKPPISALRQHKVPIAIASDLNPGTSPIASLLTSANMASVLFGLTPYESLRGITYHAAQALNIPSKGSLAIGMDADFSLWEINHPADLIHSINYHRPVQTWVSGQYV
jgi:imidazolonepropionase